MIYFGVWQTDAQKWFREVYLALAGVWLCLADTMRTLPVVAEKRLQVQPSGSHFSLDFHLWAENPQHLPSVSAVIRISSRAALSCRNSKYLILVLVRSESWKSFSVKEKATCRCNKFSFQFFLWCFEPIHSICSHRNQRNKDINKATYFMVQMYKKKSLFLKHLASWNISKAKWVKFKIHGRRFLSLGGYFSTFEPDRVSRRFTKTKLP